MALRCQLSPMTDTVNAIPKRTHVSETDLRLTRQEFLTVEMPYDILCGGARGVLVQAKTPRLSTYTQW